MTNEELAVKAKTGGSDALLELWEQESGLARIFARRRYERLKISGNMCGVEIEDLEQAAFLALVSAVGYYDPEKDFSFNSYWSNCIKSEFNSLLGVRSSKRDPLNMSTSLDAPISDDEYSETLEALIPDPSDDFEKVDERIYRAQIKSVLKREMERLSEEQQKALQLIFYKNRTRVDAAALMGVSRSAFDTFEHTAIIALRQRIRAIVS